MKEIWKPIKGYEEHYHVSNMGKVRSIPRTIMLSNGNPYTIKGGILTFSINRTGYFLVHLSRVTVRTFSVHRLVALAFMPNPKNKATINHINGIKTDNHVDNLEWCTMSENLKHAHRTGLYKSERHGNAKLNNKKVRVIKWLLKEKWHGIYITDIAKIFGVYHGTIRKIKHGKLWKNVTI